MNKITIIDNNGNIVNANTILSFHCKSTLKNYIVLDNKKDIFEKQSKYNNLDILEITKENSNEIHVANIPEEDWGKVKYAIQNEIFANFNQ